MKYLTIQHPKTFKPSSRILQTPTKETRLDEVNEMSPQATRNPAGNSNPACEESVIIKTNVANLETNFVSFKQDILKSYEEIKKDMKKKYDEIEILKKRITSLETLNELLQKDNADLTNISHKQKQLEKKVSNAITLCKDLKQKP
ncbi:Hypothetical predicted protein [Paramuricea clavata]|uniref:Uncharacterized protein n=1 Tax=Paramuricea clavata TaxID=317549 RepID=A0A7D9LGA9_PARCT|nr:Hypothetical predicted protein [Paramuricea clavata]